MLGPGLQQLSILWAEVIKNIHSRVLFSIVSLYLSHGSISFSHFFQTIFSSSKYYVLSVDEMKCLHLIRFFDGVNRLPFLSSKMEFIDVSQMSFIQDLGPKGL